MEKRELINFLNEILAPLGYKKKGNNWMQPSIELIKVINLQKSNYGNLFYINYGFIIKNLELTTVSHFENRLASNIKEEQLKISNLLNLEYTIRDEERLSELKNFIIKKVIVKMNSLNCINDLFEEIKKAPQLNKIPLIVKQYFNLPIG